MRKKVIKDPYLKQMLSTPNKLHNLHNNLIFFLDIIKIKKVRNLKQALNHRLLLQKVYRIIQFN